jgi:chemotaxis protein CheD
MKSLVVGTGDCQITRERDAHLITYGLGSCIGVGLYDPAVNVGGLLHVLLPEASLDAEKAARNPCMFADTGLTEILSRCVNQGAIKSRMKVWIAGGASVMDSGGVFNIGKRNQLAIKKTLWKLGLMIHAEDVGGTCSRTVRLNLADGTFWVRPSGAPEQELKPRGFAKAS